MLAEINYKYNNLKKREVSCYLIGHELLSEFLKNKALLSRILKDLSENDKYARDLHVLLNYLAFEYANCPLPLANAFYYRNERLNKISILVDRLCIAYPDISSQLSKILKTIQNLRLSNDNPLLDAYKKNISSEKATIILLNEEFVQVTQEVCHSEGIDIHITVPGAPVFSKSRVGIFIGCAKYFPAHVFLAPDYREQHLIRFSLFSDNIRETSLPLGMFAQMKPIKSLVKYTNTAPTENELITHDHPIEQIDLEQFTQYTNKQTSNLEDIEVQIVILKNGKFVFLPIDEKCHCVVNLGANPVHKKLKPAELDQNTAILLREKGMGDYIAQVADKILGAKSSYYRAQQHKWKTALIDQITLHGINHISNDLLITGCKSAQYVNLRNWVWPRSIMPYSVEDFRCLLKFLNLEQDTKEIIFAMKELRKSHIRAGRHIAEELKTLVRNDSNINRILTEGYKTYQLDDNTSRKLGVYVYDRMLEKTISVSYKEAGELKNIEVLYG